MCSVVLKLNGQLKLWDFLKLACVDILGKKVQ